MSTISRLVFVMLSGIAVNAYADSIRCGSDVITLGETSLRLKAKCGDPASREPLSRKEIDKRGYTHIVEYGERWTYNFGASSFMPLVTIENGLVTAIENGPRGF